VQKPAYVKAEGLLVQYSGPDLLCTLVPPTRRHIMPYY